MRRSALARDVIWAALLFGVAATSLHSQVTPARPLLTGPTTFLAQAGGVDNPNCSMAAPCLTGQALIEAAEHVDGNGFPVTLQIEPSPGYSPGPIVQDAPFVGIPSAELYCDGPTDACPITSVVGEAIYLSWNTYWSLNGGFLLQTSGPNGGIALHVSNGATVNYAGTDFGAAQVAHIQADSNASESCNGTVWWTGGTQTGGHEHLFAGGRGGGANCVVEIPNSITFGTFTVGLAADTYDSENITYDLGVGAAVTDAPGGYESLACHAMTSARVVGAFPPGSGPVGSSGCLVNDIFTDAIFGGNTNVQGPLWVGPNTNPTESALFELDWRDYLSIQGPTGGPGIIAYNFAHYP